MSVSRLRNGRFRVRVWDARIGREVAAAKVLGLTAGTTWRSKREAHAAEAAAYQVLKGGRSAEMTVGEFWQRWTTDRLFARPKESTNRHNRERTKTFAEGYGSVLLRQVDDRIVSEWLAGGRRNGTVSALRAMFNDAASAKAGRLLDHNPFARLGISRTRGNRDVKPPGQDVVWELIRAARTQAGPSLAAWLQVAAFTGMRPGELDALRWDAIDFGRSRIWVTEQFQRGRFTLPKNGRRRCASLTSPAREALLALPHESEFCFVNLRGGHWTSSSRAYHWKATRAAVGYDGSLYLATRHHAGAYMTNVLGLPSEDVAIALGHEDGGELVRRLYGHRDKDLALDRVIRAYDERANVVALSPRTRHEDVA